MAVVTALGAQVITHGGTPFTSLSAATTGTGSVIDIGEVKSQPCMVCTASAALTQTSSVILEGSIDNINWFFITKTGQISTDFAAASTFVYRPTSPFPVRYLRASIGTESANVVTVTGTITGGTITVRVTAA